MWMSSLPAISIMGLQSLISLDVKSIRNIKKMLKKSVYAVRMCFNYELTCSKYFYCYQNLILSLNQLFKCKEFIPARKYYQKSDYRFL